MNYSSQKEENKLVKKWKDNSPFNLKFSKEEINNAKLIMMAPPNMTGAVHLGHIWDLAVPDFYNRFFCLNDSKKSLFVPGKDHAGIATQAKIEKHLKEKKINVDSMTFEEKNSFANKWVEKYSKQAEKTWHVFGISQNDSFHKYTRDEDIEEEVKNLFIEYFNKGLVYRGNRIINWDTGLKTAISNEEVYWKKTESPLFHIRYQIKQSKKFLVIATTRPETIFSDVAVFLNPKDKRSKTLAGKTLINPLSGKEIPILFDNYVDMDFGSGVLKCTPHHDSNDFDLFKKHKTNVGEPSIDFDGKLTKLTNEFQGLKTKDARNKIIEHLEKNEKVEKIEKIQNEMPFSSRSNQPIEALMSKQWFFKTTSFCKKAFSNFINKGQFKPDYFDDKLEKWSDDLEDWCISRQLWWGTRMPLYFDKDNNYVAALKNPNPKIFTQVEDVFDTWFTSGHWPHLFKNAFNIDKSKKFHLVTMGVDIFFFWAVRMILASYSKEKSIPFENCYFHGLLRDNIGRKMSKSLDNGVDPLEEVKKESADTIRWALLSRNTYGNDINYSPGLLKEGKSLVFKIANATKFLFLKHNEAKEANKDNTQIKKAIVESIEQKVQNLLYELQSLVSVNLINVYCKKLWLFTFNEFCSKYIELIKKYDFTKNDMIKILKSFLKIIKVLSPVMPFFSEYILELAKKELLLEHDNIKLILNKQGKNSFTLDISFYLIEKIKLISKDHEIIDINFKIKDEKSKTIINNIVSKFFKFDKSIKQVEKNRLTILETFENQEITFYFDVKTNKKNLGDNVATLEKEIDRCKKMLSNKRFTEKAPKELVSKERKKLSKFEAELVELKKQL